MQKEVENRTVNLIFDMTLRGCGSSAIARSLNGEGEVTPEVLHEFIEKIVVHNPEVVDGKRYQKVDIYYNAIGLWCVPGPEEMEELFQYYWEKRRKL